MIDELCMVISKSLGPDHLNKFQNPKKYRTLTTSESDSLICCVCAYMATSRTDRDLKVWLYKDRYIYLYRFKLFLRFTVEYDISMVVLGAQNNR